MALFRPTSGARTAHLHENVSHSSTHKEDDSAFRPKARQTIRPFIVRRPLGHQVERFGVEALVGHSAHPVSEFAGHADSTGTPLPRPPPSRATPTPVAPWSEVTAEQGVRVDRSNEVRLSAFVLDDEDEHAAGADHQGRHLHGVGIGVDDR